jgi:hypothetical protein
MLFTTSGRSRNHPASLDTDLTTPILSSTEHSTTPCSLSSVRWTFGHLAKKTTTWGWSQSLTDLHVTSHSLPWNHVGERCKQSLTLTVLMLTCSPILGILWTSVYSRPPHPTRPHPLSIPTSFLGDSDTEMTTGARTSSSNFAPPLPSFRQRYNAYGLSRAHSDFSH